MKTPIFNLHTLSAPELGQFSVLLAQTITPKQAAKLAAAFPGMSKIDVAGIPISQSAILPHSAYVEAGKLVAGGLSIQAIKLIREKTGVGLKEAKEFYDAMLQRGIWKRPA